MVFKVGTPMLMILPVARLARNIMLVFLVAALAACAKPNPPGSFDGPGSTDRYEIPSEAQVRNLPKSRLGNMQSYVVFGKRYVVMETAAEFTEQGVASWYGSKFHGRNTSSGEVYNMYDMTAAHKHLPLPTFVEVTNLDNNRQVIVKVNDRGPFSGERIIDMSFAAARELDMLESGTANVFVRGLSTHHVENVNASPAQENVPATANTESYALQADAGGVATETGSVELNPVVGVEDVGDSTYTIQLGAFSQKPNAMHLVDSVSNLTGLPAYVERDSVEALFRVKMGPFSEGERLHATLQELTAVGIDSYAIPAVEN